MHETNVSAEGLDEAIARVKRHLEIQRFKQTLASPGPYIRMQDVDILDGYEFERFLKRLFEKMGYQVEHTKLSGDQGGDLVLIKLGERVVVQAKRYGGAIGNRAVQEITAAVNHYRADKGIVVTNSYFTAAAVQLAKSNRIELIDRDKLENMIKTYM